MRIVSLHAARVGRWSPQTFTFGPGLTVVYGPNEAGKSTALRALEALLFPVETRGSDGFAALTAPLSPNQFDATVTLARDGADGSVETIQWRRKGKVLVDGHEHPVLPEVAHAWLWETSQTDFRTLYALGHERLRDHQGLLGKDSALGRVLTEMATGGRNLAFYQSESQAELERQYRPKGKNHRLNNALLLADQAVKNVKQADESRGHQAFQRAKTAQQETKARRAELDGRLTELQAAVRELERLAFAPPQLAELAQKTIRIEELRAKGPILGLRWCEEMIRRCDGFETLRREHASAQRALAEAESGLRGRVPSARVLDLEDQVERAIHLREALVLRPERRAKLVDEARDRERALRVALAQLGLEPGTDGEHESPAARDEPPRFERWVPPATVRHALEKTFKTLVEAEETERRARQAWAALDESQREQSVTVARLSSTDEDEDAIRALRAWKAEAEEGGSAQGLVSLREATHKRALELALTARQLGFSPDLPLPACAAVRLPPDELLADRRTACERASAQSQQLEAAFREARDRQTELADRLARSSHALPPDLDLPSARRARDEAWQALREAEAGGVDPVGRVRGVRAFEQAERRLDETVDGVVQHANAVAELGELSRTHAEAARQVEARAQERAEASLAVAEARTHWEAAWADTGLAAPPVEQVGFLRDVRKFVKEVEASLVDEATLTQREAAVTALTERLRAGLSAHGLVAAPEAGLRHLVQMLDDHLGRLQTQRGAREIARESLAKLERESLRATERLQTAEAATQAARAELTRVAESATLPLALVADTEQLRRWVADSKSLAEQLRALQEAERAVSLADDEQRARLETIADVVKLLVERGVALPGEDATPLARLDAIVRAVRDARTTRTLEENAEKAREVAARRARGFEDWRAGYHAALTEAGLPEDAYAFEAAHDEDAGFACLTALLERSAEYHRADADRSRIRLEASRAAQLEFDHLEARLAGRSQASLTDEKNALDRQITALEAERRQAHEAELAATQTVQTMELGGDHDTLRQSQESALATLAEEMRATLTAKGATLLLGELADALTAHDQRALLLERASRFLHTVTVGAFEEVRTDGEDGLLVVRGGGADTLSVTELSEGTRDQVYLALRLAVAQGTLETKRLPFLLDDVLVHFDDARAVATLRAFAELGRHTQVILFTHHEHLIERAKHAGIAFDTIVLDGPPIAEAYSTSVLSNGDAVGPQLPSPRKPRRPSLATEASRALAAAQLELLTPVLPEGSEEAFLDALRTAGPVGEKVSTSALKKRLPFDDATFNAVRAALLQAGQVVPDGRSLRLIADSLVRAEGDRAAGEGAGDASVGQETNLDK
jgi:uncharacterized protein YhaN